MSDVAAASRRVHPAISRALLQSASQQLRNMASIGGNLLQRTRCGYFRDVNMPCNRREPGSGCSAITGANRMHAMLGTSDSCVATHASDLAVALVALDARVRLAGPDGERTVALADFYRLPGDTPEVENDLRRWRADHRGDRAPTGLGEALDLREGPRPAVLRVRAVLGRGRAGHA